MKTVSWLYYVLYMIEIGAVVMALLLFESNLLKGLFMMTMGVYIHVSRPSLVRMVASALEDPRKKYGGRDG